MQMNKTYFTVVCALVSLCQWGISLSTCCDCYYSWTVSDFPVLVLICQLDALFKCSRNKGRELTPSLGFYARLSGLQWGPGHPPFKLKHLSFLRVIFHRTLVQQSAVLGTHAPTLGPSKLLPDFCVWCCFLIVRCLFCSVVQLHMTKGQCLILHRPADIKLIFFVFLWYPSTRERRAVSLEALGFAFQATSKQDPII